MSGFSRVSIPNSVKKTIQNIKEIAGNHSDDEIYAMLKECSMDPNETTQKLLFQDTFHEVKRKRDKRKENNREVADTRWRPVSQGRGGRGGRGNYTPRYTSYDSDARRDIGVGKENVISEAGGKGSTSILSPMPLATEKTTTRENNSIIPISSSMSSMPNGPIKSEHLLSDKFSFSAGASIEGLSAVTVNKGGPSLADGNVSLSSSGQNSSISVVSASGVYTSLSDPVLLPSGDGHALGAVGENKHEVGSHSSIIDTTVDRIVPHDTVGSELSFLHETVASEKCHTFVNGQAQGNFQEIEGGQVLETSQAASPSSSITGTSGSRPSSNYSNRSQRPSAPIKTGPAKEWKPKSTIVNAATVSGVLSTSGVDVHIVESVTCSMPLSDPMVPDNVTKIQNKLVDLLVSDTKHVIIPDHLQVSESERSGLSFGSFDSNFKLTMRFKDEPDSEESPGEPSESSRGIEGNAGELPSSTVDSSKVAEENSYPGNQKRSMPEIQSVELDIPPSISPAAENDQSKSETSLTSVGLQHSVIHTAPVYSNFGLVPPMLGSHIAALESADPQAHETTRLPSFVVPQPFDPSSNYYTSIYRPAIDGDGRFSPLLAPSAATKYNGAVAVLSAKTGQSSQEGGNSLVLSSTGSNHLVTQAAGVVQTSIAAGQQPIPVFRQPAGVHIPNYPPNYVHYSQYFSPFYVPPPAAIHHFLGNAAAFPQQPPPGSIFPLPTATAGTNPVKFPISQYKPATNSGPTGQVTYGLNPVVYSSAVSSGNSSGSEDLASSQFKDNNVFMTGQQSEGSAVWMSPPARDISTFQPSSFYNIPPQGQLAFAPNQAGHAASAFTSIYHPTQSIPAGSVHPLLQQSQAVGGAAEMGGPPVGVYQQPQRASPINWINNY